MIKKIIKPKNEVAEDYPVGYKKPPVETRFKPGVSGNPKGRPKGKHNYLTIIKQELDRPITITENGKKTTISAVRAATRQNNIKGVKGNTPAYREMIKLMFMAASLEDQQSQSGLTPEFSQEMMEYLKKRILSSTVHKSTEEEDA